MKPYFTLVLVLFSFIGFAQESTITDFSIVGTIFPSRAIPEKSVLLNVSTMGIKSNYRYSTPTSFKSFVFPNVSVGIGLTNRIDLRVFTQYISSEFVIDTVTILNEGWSGFGGSSTINITDQKGWLPELSGSVGIWKNTLYSTSNLRTDLSVTWKYRWESRFHLTGSFSYYMNSQFANNFQLGVRAGYEIIDGVGVFVAFRPTNSERLDSYLNQNIYMGAYWRIVPKLQLSVNGWSANDPNDYWSSVVKGLNVSLNWQIGSGN